MTRRTIAAAALALSSLAAACGGSSSGAGSGGTVSGEVVKGPVSGATVTAYAIASSGARGAPLGSATTDDRGRFTVSVGQHSGPFMLAAAGGRYTDEATGTSMPLASGDVMTAAVPAMDAGATMQGVHVTPLTSMAQAWAAKMPGGMTPANVGAANSGVGDYFMVHDIVGTDPMDALASGAGATPGADARNYGMTIAALCEYARTVGMTDSSGMVTAMMEDASDGVMDGMMGTTPISMAGMGGMGGGGMMGGGPMMSPTAGTAGLASAMSAFVGSAMNRSGVTASDMQGLMDRLAASSGALP